MQKALEDFVYKLMYESDKISFGEYYNLFDITRLNDSSKKLEYNKYQVTFKYNIDSELKLFDSISEARDYIKELYEDGTYFEKIK